ncbi:DUF3467 domain-containing protein [Thermodesulfobacteriota bacterium]
MAESNAPEKEQKTTLPKMVNIQDEGYYSNCTMVETTPFDISVLFGKVRPRTDDQGNRTLVEVYEKQVYLSHLQARALHEALGRSLNALRRQQGPEVVEAPQKKQ